MSYDEFRRRIDTARNILVGAVPSPAGQIDQITYALIYKFMNDIDDKAASLPGGKRTYFTGDYEKYNWHALMSTSLGAHERLELYRQAIQTMSKNENLPPLFREIYQNAFLPFNSANVLSLFLKEMDKFDHSDSDDIGDAYEYLLSITGSQGDVGQFRTPRHIIKFIVEAINPTKDDSVLDPACGTAGFLIAVYNHVKSQHDGVGEVGNKNGEKRLNSDDLAKIHKSYRGFDIDPTMVRTAEVNLYLHGFTTPDIRNHDTLSSEEYWDKKYDVILANPPFMTPKGGIQPHKKFSINANRAEVLFVDYIASHINPVSGRAGIVVPEGIIFQSGNAYKQLRKNLVENSLYAVVSLPAGVFQPYSGVKKSILLLDKKLAKERNDILFVEVENDGYTLGAQRRRDELKDQLPQSLDAIKLYQENFHQDKPLAHSVSRKEIAEGGNYNLSGERYKKVVDSSHCKWLNVKLQEIFTEIKNGKNVKQFDEIGKYKVSRIQTIAKGVVNLEATKWTSDEVDKNDFLQDGDILFSHINSYEHLAKTAIFNSQEKVVHGANLLRLRPDLDKIIPEYAISVLKSDRFREDAKRFAQKAVNQASINSTSIKSLEIPLPPIEIQREIVTELNGYQKIIDAAQTIVQTYKPTIKINPEWDFKVLSTILDVRDGTHDSPKYITNGYPLVTSKNLKNGVLDFSDINYISKIDLGNINKRSNVEDGDILMPMIGTIGGAVRILKSREFAIKNVALIKPKDDNTDMAYICFMLNSDFVNSILSASATGGTQKFVSLGFIRKIEIPLPPIEIQREIVTELEAEQKLIEANKKLIEIYQQKINSKIFEIWG